MGWWVHCYSYCERSVDYLLSLQAQWPQHGEFWHAIDLIRREGTWCIGDWNVIKFPGVLGSLEFFRHTGFLKLDSISLVDLPLTGASFTWSNHQASPSISRLDRFLVSIEQLVLLPNTYQLTLPKTTSDHHPIALDSNPKRWGRCPFHFELMLLEERCFPNLIHNRWEEIPVEVWAGQV